MNDFNLLDMLEDGLENGDSGSSRLPFTKFEEGNTHITVLGAVPARWTHYHPVSKLTIDCTGRDTCPVCAIIAAAKKDEIECDYKSTQKFGMVVYNHNSKKLEILDQKVTFIKSLKSMLQELKDDGEVFDPTKFVTRIRREGTGFNDTKYTFKVAPEAMQAVVPDEIVEQFKGIDMSDLFLKMTPENVKKLLAGQTLKEIFSVDDKPVDGLEVDFK